MDTGYATLLQNCAHASTDGVACCLPFVLGEPFPLPITHQLHKVIWLFFKKKSKTEIPYDTANLLLRIHPNELKSVCQRSIWTLMFFATLFAIAKNWEQHTFPLTDE